MNILIIGCGAMGSSLAARLEKDTSHAVYVYDVKPLDSYFLDTHYDLIHIQKLKRHLVEMDLIILAVPIDSIFSIGKKIKKSKTKAIIIDLCSVKKSVYNDLSFTLSKKQLARYIPCHPLIGTEKTGLDGFNIDMFKNFEVILTLTIICDPNVYKTVDSFWKSLGAKTIEMGLEEHDKVMANTSHLNQFLAYYFKAINVALVNSGYIEEPLSLPSLKESLRLSNSNPELWDGIFKSNSHEMISSIDNLMSVLRSARELLVLNQPLSTIL